MSTGSSDRTTPPSPSATSLATFLTKKSSRSLDANLTRVLIKVCAKCGRNNRRLSRHHKGHEYLWACLLPEFYAKRYNEFRKEDVVSICQRPCHENIHKIFRRRLGKLGFWELLGDQGGVITHKQAEHYRLLLVQTTDEWLARRRRRR